MKAVKEFGTKAVSEIWSHSSCCFSRKMGPGVLTDLFSLLSFLPRYAGDIYDPRATHIIYLALVRFVITSAKSKTITHSHPAYPEGK